MALLTSIAALAAALPACDDERHGGVEPATEARHACIPRGDGHARICGLEPPRRSTEDGSAYKVTTIVGERFWVVLPGRPAPDVVAVPLAPLRVPAELTTAPPREAAARFCDGFPECEPVVVDHKGVPEPLDRWDDASGSIRDLAVTTLGLGAWTLVLSQTDARRAERVARAIRAKTGADGYPRLASTDPGVPLDRDWAGVLLWVAEPDREGRHDLIHVVPGCGLTTKDPNLGGSDAGPELELHEPETVAGGSWCAGGRHWVDVSFAARPRVEQLHETLRIVPAAG